MSRCVTHFKIAAERSFWFHQAGGKGNKRKAFAARTAIGTSADQIPAVPQTDRFASTADYYRVAHAERFLCNRVKHMPVHKPLITRTECMFLRHQAFSPAVSAPAAAIAGITRQISPLNS